MPHSTTLWYFADPMCSWCWGFSQVIEQVRSSYHDRMNIALMLGGLRPGTTEPMSDALREEILHHWHEVTRLSGQSFNFDGALPPGFIYDTEPACRAVITVADLSPERIFDYFKSVQSAFYLDHIDVTRAENLARLAEQQDIQGQVFLDIFDKEKIRDKTLQHFMVARQVGVTGFPTLVMQRETEYEFITRGYQAYEPVSAAIERCLQKFSDQ